MILVRPQMRWHERLYFSAIARGMLITGKHLMNRFLGRTHVTMQYPEEKPVLPSGYRGAPVLVMDEAGREKCVSCQLCEFVCPPRAIRIQPAEIMAQDPNAHVEKAPKEFEIDMLRCIYCGLCEEVCPEEAIFLRNDYAITAVNRAEAVHNKKKLYELGGVMQLPIHKWQNK